MRRFAIALALFVAVQSAGAAAARADVVVHGRGFGHGIGMSQYGAYGFALKAHEQYDWILQHYYPGTDLEDGGSQTIRVKLRSAARSTVCGVTRAVDADGRTVRLHQSRFYVVSAVRGLLRFRDAFGGRTRAVLHSPVTLTGGRDVCLSERADNGVVRGHYRGALVLTRQGRRVLVVNDVNVERYLYGVVSAEMPAGWPLQALEAQAVASRTYALGARRPDAPYDVFSDTRSQVYRGMRGESPPAIRAVHATSRQVVTYQGSLAQTYFFSTSGGRTAAIDQVWGVDAVPYLHPVSDPYDYLSPVHTWTARFSRHRLERLLGRLVRGHLRRLRVTARTPVGRVKTIEIYGSRGRTKTDGATFRTRARLRSTWFRIGAH